LDFATAVVFGDFFFVGDAMADFFFVGDALADLFFVGEALADLSLFFDPPLDLRVLDLAGMNGLLAVYRTVRICASPMLHEKSDVARKVN
jgi:hypothetical protein